MRQSILINRHIPELDLGLKKNLNLSQNHDQLIILSGKSSFVVLVIIWKKNFIVILLKGQITK